MVLRNGDLPAGSHGQVEALFFCRLNLSDYCSVLITVESSFSQRFYLPELTTSRLFGQMIALLAEGDFS